ncbi:hypothetical protein CEXT_119951, partial [Caerostris extrusa]
ARKLFSIGSSDEESILSEPSPVMPCTSIDENSDVEELVEDRWDQKLFSIGNSGDNFISSDPSIIFRFDHLIVDDENGERDAEMSTLPFMSRSSFLEKKTEVECFDDSEELLAGIGIESDVEGLDKLEPGDKHAIIDIFLFGNLVKRERKVSAVKAWLLSLGCHIGRNLA